VADARRELLESDPVRLEQGQPALSVRGGADVGWRLDTNTGCDGVVSRVRWNNTGQKTFYAHLPQAHVAGVLTPAVYQIVPGDSRNITSRTILHAAGLDSRADIVGAEGLDLNEIPPQPGETLINP
jgi:hypothetical protein